MNLSSEGKYPSRFSPVSLGPKGCDLRENPASLSLSKPVCGGHLLSSAQPLYVSLARSERPEARANEGLSCSGTEGARQLQQPLHLTLGLWGHSLSSAQPGGVADGRLGLPLLSCRLCGLGACVQRRSQSAGKDTCPWSSWLVCFGHALDSSASWSHLKSDLMSPSCRRLSFKIGRPLVKR